MLTRILEAVTFGAVVPSYRLYEEIDTTQRLRGRIAALSSQCNAQEEELNGLNAHAQRLQQQIDDLHTEMAKVRGQKHDVQQRLDSEVERAQRFATKLDRIQNVLEFGVCDDNGLCPKCNENHEGHCRP